MADSDSNLDLLADGRPLNRRTVNELADALSPGSYWARRFSSTDDFTWGYYGGVINGTRYANGTLDLSAFPSTTVYIEHTTLGVPSANTTGFTAGSIRDYRVVTSADGVSSYEDLRESGALANVIGSYDSGTFILTFTAPDGKKYELGPFA